jgi:O-6-methylguanine DNA methyltransferase
MQKQTIETKAGAFTAWFSERGLARLEFPNGKIASKATDETVSPQARKWLKLTATSIEEALAGKTPRTLPPLDLSRGSQFQVAVWNALAQIPPGKTRSYSEIAMAIGQSRAVRAVGGACGENPIPLFIPCHRVLRKGGGLGGFSGGLHWKRRLLEIEHSAVLEAPRP